VQELLKQAKGRQAAVVVEWTREVPRIMPDAREWDDEVLEEKCTDYMLE
jgi:phosphoserine phosphatase